MKPKNLEKRPGSTAALLIVDMISDFNFEDGDKLFPRTLPVAKRISEFREAFHGAGLPVVFVNDELGQDKGPLSDNLSVLRSLSSKAVEILDLLSPEPADHWVEKPQRSGFYSTSLDELLASLDVASVVVTGITSDICVLFTAHDAYMRGYSVNIPADCTTAVEDSYLNDALRFAARVAEAETSGSEVLCKKLIRSR